MQMTSMVVGRKRQRRVSGDVSAVAGGFNDPLTSDVVLSLAVDDPCTSSPLDIHLHSHVLLRSNYFAASLSDRWHLDRDSHGKFLLHLHISGTIDSYLTVLRLLYSTEFSDTILNASIALSLLPAAMQLLFDECVQACLRFLEAVPWTDEEENILISLIPSLGLEDTQEILARLLPPCTQSSERMLDRLITSSIGNHPHAFASKVKAFAAKMLRDFPSRELVRRVLDRAFDASLKTVKESLEKYSSPDFRGDNEEVEAIQRVNLHTAVYYGKDLLWLVELMIELKHADKAVTEWSNQTTFVADLRRTFQDDAWRNIAPILPTLVLRCTGRLADAVATGSVLAAKQMRLKLVSVWLPVLSVWREKNVAPISPGQKLLCQELEVTFLRIISTLPMSDAASLLHDCLSFATRNVEDCPHLVSAFSTWFRRATRVLPVVDKDGDASGS